MVLKSVCVFCGASNNVNKKYINAAIKFGKTLADRNIKLVYGGGDCGLMGAVANGTLKAGGHVTGVFPSFLSRYESEHKSLTEMILVEDMHSRKWRMFQESGAFVIFPGGFGTMDEAFEIITWKILGVHDKPIIFFNHDGYWDNFFKLTNGIIKKGFARATTAKLYKSVKNLDKILPAIEADLKKKK